MPICAPWSGRPCFADHAADGDGAEHVLTATGLAACMVCGRSNASRCSCGAAICTVAKGGTGAYGRCYRSHLRENGALLIQTPMDSPAEDGSGGRAARPDEGPARLSPPQKRVRPRDGTWPSGKGLCVYERRTEAPESRRAIATSTLPVPYSNLRLARGRRAPPTSICQSRPYMLLPDISHTLLPPSLARPLFPPSLSLAGALASLGAPPFAPLGGTATAT